MSDKDTKNQGLFPVPGFYFSVEIDGKVISFQEVAGLDQESEVLEYRVGNSKNFITQKRLGMAKSSTVTFKKGVFELDDRLGEMAWDAIIERKFHSTGKPIDLLVYLNDENGSPIASWAVYNAIPVKVTGPTLKSDSSEVAIESIEFAHEGLDVLFH
ncbi:MAG: phage tail protein [Bacteroidia bacterium]|nr:phage tail protein [Bacteroidia bacterium]